MRLAGMMAVMLALLTSAAAGEDAAQVRSVTLKNGLRVLLLPDPRAAAVDVAVWYRAGTRSEQGGKTGLSTLVGRLSSRGANDRPGETRRLIEAEGGTASDLVNPDYSCFYQTVPPEAVEAALRIEAARMRALPGSAASFEAERRTLGQEQRARLGASPFVRSLQQLYRNSYGGHPYAWPVSGLEQDLSRITLADVQAYHRERYAPENALLTVVGRFEVEPTLAAIRQAFEPLARRPVPPLPRVASARPETRRAVEVTSAPSPVLLVGWRGPGRGDPDNPAWELLSRIVTSGPGSRIQQLPARQGSEFLLAQGELDQSREASLLFCIAAVRAGVDTARAESLLVAEVESLARTPVSADELERARRHVEMSAASSAQTVRGRAQLIGAAAVLEGDYQAAAKRMERIRSLGPADLQRAAARLLSPSSRSVVWILPGSGSGTSSTPEARP